MLEIAKNDYYTIALDKVKNRMYLKLIGFWKDPSDVPDYVDDIQKSTKELSSGFTILTDVRDFKIPSKKVAPIHVKAQKILVDAGLRKTAELVPEEKALEKMSLRKISEESGMQKQSFGDKKEAEAWLDE